MPDDTGTQYAGLTDAEKVLARADDHMSMCDEPQMADCETCTRRIGKYRKYLAVLADAGLLVRVGICGDRAADVFPNNGPTSVCDLPAGHAGWHGAPNPTDSTGIPSRISWTVRDEPLVLTLLDDAPAAGPRVWAIPEIPDDVKQVRDADGEVWTRLPHDGSWAHPDDEPEGLSGTPEAGLLMSFGPLTEVLPNGD